MVDLFHVVQEFDVEVGFGFREHVCWFIVFFTVCGLCTF